VTPIIELADVSKDYRGLRPLRIQQMTLARGERVALLGLDQVAAEVFVNLVTGATLPESGSVRLFGRPTNQITDATDWLAVVDRVGIVSERAVLLDGLTALQNLAIPFTLDIEPLGGDARAAAETLAREIELPASRWDAAVATLDPAAQMRIRLGRALALDPDALLLEHVTARLLGDEVAPFAQSIKAIAERRGVAVLSVGVDEGFAAGVASRVMRWEAATGRLSERRGWFGRRLG